MLLGFDPSELSPASKVEYLREVAQLSLLDFDKLQALYLVVGDDVFYTLALFAGDEIQFPPRRTLRRAYLRVAGPQQTEETP